MVVVGGELVSSLTTTFSLAGSSSTKQGQLLLNKTRLGYEVSYHVFLIRLLSYKCYDVECLIYHQNQINVLNYNKEDLWHNTQYL